MFGDDVTNVALQNCLPVWVWLGGDLGEELVQVGEGVLMLL